MTTYLRTNRSFTAVSTYASSGRLSVGAIGLLTLILSNHDAFVIYKGALQRRSKVGKKLFKRFWKELEENGFVYEIISNNGRINYEYIIVNDPSHESNIEAIDQILENREPFLIDGEMDTDNDLLNIVDGEEGTNIYLNNQDLSNEDLNNEDIPENHSIDAKNGVNSKIRGASINEGGFKVHQKAETADSHKYGLSVTLGGTSYKRRPVGEIFIDILVLSSSSTISSKSFSASNSPSIKKCSRLSII